MWLKKLQIAIIEKDINSIEKLMSDMPDFKTIDDMKFAASLIKEGLKLLHSLKDETRIELQKLKKHKDFLDSMDNETHRVQRLDVTF